MMTLALVRSKGKLFSASNRESKTQGILTSNWLDPWQCDISNGWYGCQNLEGGIYYKYVAGKESNENRIAWFYTEQ